ncbi:Cytoplasmic glyoxalase II [Conoideocrella luteorostrata]|uniref:Cytoplasmic glyoxalase II n=1 Tax=Conoideocrella luteorostrata TaxID=1105319 RepID=A0AAJ0CCP4_9HYPO|nr:Cytoplasmic glyoxalase II [Conoideocrella luteorostrata]
MVQYILTPWRDRQELLLVREQFYDPSATGTDDALERKGSRFSRSSPGKDLHTSSEHFAVRVASGGAVPTAEKRDYAPDQQNLSSHGDEDDGDDGTEKKHQQRQAVARVSMWMQRGNCPHMVESTALLMAAVLSDDGDMATYAVRAAYSAAFSRFVTGLLDGHQDKQRKQSMYSIAKTIGLPATFVELRHQATHEQLPSLAKLRSAARKALEWIWNYYWKHLPDEGGSITDPCREVVLLYLRGSDEAQTIRDLAVYERDRVLAVIGELQGSLPGNQVYLRCLKLSKEVLMREEERKDGDLNPADESAAEASASGDDAENAGSSSGWSLYEGPWKPKPIGMV